MWVQWNCSFYYFSAAVLRFCALPGARTSQLDSVVLTKVFLSVDGC